MEHLWNRLRTAVGRTALRVLLAIPVAILAVAVGGKLFETVEKGTYQIKQAAVTGTMSAKLTPGLWPQLWGDITVWPKAETFYFTADREEGSAFDQSIEVRFNDGSLCRISGTCRIVLPTTEPDALALVTVHGYRTFPDMEQKLILPVVRNALRLTANLMSARESYSDKRPDFINWSWDQVQNGLHETEEDTHKVLDPLSGEMITKTFKIIRTDDAGNPIYQRNPLEATGIRLANFEIKEFVYADKVQEQIATQQEALMAVATASARAKQAEQEALTVEAEGKAQVMRARYEEEQKKVRSVVEAQKDKEVAETQAHKLLEVAKLEKEAAEFARQKDILLGQGEAERKRLVLQADGALREKLETYERVNARWADAYSKRQVPTLVMGGNGAQGTDQATLDFNQAMQLLVANQMGLDLKVAKGAQAPER
jgi:regulator of protease activity HflC (stomatin/prohibitin superfamily)